MDAIAAWEELRDRYYECGGQQLNNEDQCTDIMKIPPPDPETPASMLMALEGYIGDPENLKLKIDSQITFFQEHSKRQGRVNLAEAQEYDEEGHDQSPASELPNTAIVDLTVNEEHEQTGILAFIRADGNKRPVRTDAFRGRPQKRGDQATRPRARTPPKGSTARTVHCGNLGASTKHAIAPSQEWPLISASVSAVAWRATT